VRTDTGYLNKNVIMDRKLAVSIIGDLITDIIVKGV
jgi:hypothetical protein